MIRWDSPVPVWRRSTIVCPCGCRSGPYDKAMRVDSCGDPACRYLAHLVGAAEDLRLEVEDRRVRC